MHLRIVAQRCWPQLLYLCRQLRFQLRFYGGRSFLEVLVVLFVLRVPFLEERVALAAVKPWAFAMVDARTLADSKPAALKRDQITWRRLWPWACAGLELVDPVLCLLLLN